MHYKYIHRKRRKKDIFWQVWIVHFVIPNLNAASHLGHVTEHDVGSLVQVVDDLTQVSSELIAYVIVC